MTSRGVLGLKGQGMAARKPLPLTLIQVISTQDVGSYTLTEDCIADIFAWGGGASGTSNSTESLQYGGGGGSAGYARRLLSRGQVLSWSPGARGNTTNGTSSNLGGDTTVSVDGVLLGTAQGGRAASTGGPAARSTATGFDVNRYGGGSGEAGERGGAPGSGQTSSGGGAGGFADLFGGFTGGDGTQNLNSSTVPTVAETPGGGGGSTDAGLSGGTSYSSYGGEGQVLIMLYRAAI